MQHHDLVLAVTAAVLAWPASAVARDVGLLHTCDDLSLADDVETSLATCPGISSVTQLNSRQTTVAYGQMAPYDVLLVFIDEIPPQPHDLGDDLASYVDAGGGVVSCGNTAWETLLEGDWDDYDPLLDIPYPAFASPEYIDPVLPTHPLLDGVASFYGGSSSWHLAASPRGDSEIVALWTDGAPLVTHRVAADAYLISINFWPASSLVESGSWDPNTSDGRALLCNAVASAGTQDMDQDGYEWDDDCDDYDDGVNPGAVELLDGLDNDCDGFVDEDWVAMGDVIVTEIHVDPDAVADAHGEYFEVLSLAGMDVDLWGWKLRDLGGEEHVVTEHVVLEPGDRAVLGIDGDTGANGSVPVDYVYAGLTFDDTVDEIVLELDNRTIDTVLYDSATFPVVAGAAMSLDPDLLGGADNDLPDSWCSATSVIIAGGDRGTPGDPNDDCCFDNDGDGFTDCGGDCDDDDATIHPGATELCDGVDNNCDGTLPDDEADHDGDGYRGCAGDCNGYDANVHPGSPETADGLDNDCDGTVDEGTAWYDDDGDGYAEDGGDCDDGDAGLHPGAVEAENGVDDDCDGIIDEGTDAYDDDGDGHSEDDGDCNDGDPDANPGETEVEDGIDNDCNGVVDDGAAGVADEDGDGYAPGAGDCDDDDPTVFPGAPEIPDGIDNDCDGTVDEGTDAYDDDDDGYTEDDGDCHDGDDTIHPGADDPQNGIDDDCDGILDGDTIDSDDDLDGFTEHEGDCDDTNADVSPLGTEVADGIDNDCDGLVDETTPAFDDDGDGLSEEEGDCNDDDPFVYPGAEELCDGELDEDCDGTVDEGCDIEPSTGDCECSLPRDGSPAGGSALAVMVLLAGLVWRRR